MAKFGVGQPVRRVEDQRLITGGGRYTDDIDLPGQAYRLRRALARGARPDHVDRHRGGQGGARRAGGDHRRRIEAERRQRLPCVDPDGEPRRLRGPATRCGRCCAPTGCAMSATPSRSWSPRRSSQAKDAAELIAVEYESLPAVGRHRDRGRRRPARWCTTTCPATSSSTGSTATAAAVEAAFAKAAPRHQAAGRQQPPGRQRDGAARRDRRVRRRRTAASRCNLHAGRWLFTRHRSPARLKVDAREAPRPDARRRRRLRHEGLLLPRIRAWSVGPPASSGGR